MTIILVVIGAVVLIGLAVLLIRVGLNAPTGSGDIQVRLEEYGGRTAAPLTLEELELSQPFSQRVIRPMLVTLSKQFSKLSPAKSRAAAEKQLELAGRPNNWGATEFLG